MALAKVSVALPFSLGTVEWKPDNAERDAAWELYVEVVTRISVQPLPHDQGMIREALSSLYTLFGTTREVLKAHGPAVGVTEPSVGWLAIAVLNSGLRPFLTRWHSDLAAWEARRPDGVGPIEHERNWPHADQFRMELEALRLELHVYADALMKVSRAR